MDENGDDMVLDVVREFFGVVFSAARAGLM